MDQVRDPHFFGPTKTLDVQVAALRRTLGDPAWIENRRRISSPLDGRTLGPWVAQVP
ncbi:helix-turn-helix domain-containing protein [Streptomyces sp. KR80]|uniref:helix-turn-helix domain-containing protein n=1 Tax=Streptomyces sp. KR80 TaxID=3457426 RepID=UPI003FD395AD